MPNIEDQKWKELDFPPILEHLQGLTPKKTGVVVDSAIEFQFGEWLQNVVLDHVRKYWPKFFFEWYVKLHQLIAQQKGLSAIIQQIYTIYEKAGKPQDWMGIKVVGHGDLSIWLTESKFILREGSEIKYFPIISGQERESVIRFGQALALHHPVLGMKTDIESILKFIKGNNDPNEHMDLCWPYIVSNFISALRDVNVGSIIQITESEILRKHAGERPLQFQVVKKANLIIFFSYNQLIVLNRKSQESRSYRLDNEKQVKDFQNTLRESASSIYADMPVTKQEVRQALANLNNLKSGNLDSSPPNNGGGETDPTMVQIP